MTNGYNQPKYEFIQINRFKRGDDAMPKLDRWIVASKMVHVIDAETMKKILDLGGQIGGGWCRIHQHISVNPENKEAIESILQEQGFEITTASDVRHPEIDLQH
jgi:hypothetical protein